MRAKSGGEPKGKRLLIFMVVLLVGIAAMSVPVLAKNNPQAPPPQQTCTPGTNTCDTDPQTGLTCDAAANLVTTCCDDNPTCADIVGCSGTELKVDGFPSGPYPKTVSSTDGVLTVAITYLSSTEITWSANLPAVKVVMMKGGNGACVYTTAACDATSSGSIHLTTPVGNNNGKHKDISHVDFCYGTAPGPSGSICGEKFQAPDGTELPGWEIQLFQGNTLIGTAITGPNGYCFNNLPSGDYTVKEVLKPTFECVDPCLDPTHGQKDVTLNANAQTGAVVDFFNRNIQQFIPEFPTVGVSMAVLIGLGFIVFTMRQKRP
jgi:hypothetical protein